jgi:hypothetical protein
VSHIPTFDIESVGWTYPISIGFFSGDEYYEFVRKDESDDVVWRFLTFLRQFEGIKLFAHCASRYDNLFILQTLCKYEEPLELKAGTAQLHWTGPNITFEDSYLLAPMKLSKLNEMLGVREKEVWDHTQKERPWEMSQDKLRTFRAYQMVDCISLSESMRRLCEEIGRAFGVEPSITMATTAVKTISKVFYDLNLVDSSEYVEDFIRAAIYGARNEIYRRYGENIHHFDVHDMYTSCYNVPVPVSELRWAKPNLDTATVIEAKAKIPEDVYIGPLPYRAADGRLLFPRGELPYTWWDAQEVRNAVTKCNVDISIRRALQADEKPVLAGFGQYMSRLRNDLDHPLAKYWKLFGLAPSGKFGQSRWRDITRHMSAVKNFRGTVPIDKSEIYFKSTEYTKGKAPYIKPALAMRIRAEARIRHLDFLLEAHQHGNIYYCDTDSVFCDHKFPVIEKPRSGELAYLGKVERGYFIRQKLYGLVVDGALIQKSSGYSDIKLTEENLRELLKGGNYEFDSENLPNYQKVLRESDLELIRSRKMIHAAFLPNREEDGDDSRPVLIKS